jgi:hypothetical protein
MTSGLSTEGTRAGYIYCIIRNLMKTRKLSTLPTPKKEVFTAMGTWVDFQAIKQAVGLAQVLDRYGIKLKRAGRLPQKPGAL